MELDKKKLSERDICTKFITPALEAAGWDPQTQFLEELNLTNGRIHVRGHKHRRGKKQRCDYVLFYKPNLPVAVIEAKDNNHTVGHGMQQALGYAESLEVPFVFSSNGDAFLFHDRTVLDGQREKEVPLAAFPSPDELWDRYCKWRQLDTGARSLVAEDYHSDGSGKQPRYYQINAVNRAIEAVAGGQDRILLVMATGTGKTYTAFQIIWRLWKSRTKKRILFLADRNILVDQTRTNDFKPFGPQMTKIRGRKVDPSYEIYLSLYQAITGPEEAQKAYKQFTPDFFDLIVIDECHRGSASEDSAWREILDYFESATQLGMTATPKETEYVSNIHYFGEPVYQYTLKQGIDDGFLAPYKVVRIDIDKDLEGWRPSEGQRDKYGEQIEDRVYNQRDLDRILVLEKRTDLVAARITEYLKGTNRYDKTIVFCEDIDHAERMRQALVNQNADLVDEDARYVMRITGDSDEGKAQLDSFIDPESRYPVIATTSRLMSTGVDAQTCKLVVLDRRIQSMTEFKQIIGRGTRINEDFGKFFFTIMDFKKATELFADPDFDGDPVQIYQPENGDPAVPPEEDDEGQEPAVEPDDEYAGPWVDPDANDTAVAERRKYYVDDVEVSITGERIQYLDGDGNLIVESIRDYSRRGILREYATMDDFLQQWTTTEQKQAIVDELEERGIMFDVLAESVGRDYGAFDLICHVAFDQPPLTRKERADNVRKRDYFTRYGADVRAVLEALLQKYADEGIDDLESMEILKVQPLSTFGTPMEIVQRFGSKVEYLRALRELEAALYAEAG